MANDLISMTANVPAHLVGRIGTSSALGDSLGGGITMGAEYPRISIKGSRFRIIEGGVESILDTMALQVVIVGCNPGVSKAWYATAWNPDASEGNAPDCYSMAGVQPNSDSTQPQSDMCATCPQNAFGSRTTLQGTKVKACADQKRLAVVAADDPSGSIYLLQATPAALKGLKAYQVELTRHGIAPEIARTKVSFDTDASYPKLKFEFGGYVAAEAQAIIDARLDDKVIHEITGEALAEAASVAQAPASVVAEAPPVVPTPPAASLATTAAPEPVVEKKATGFGPAAPVETAVAPVETAAPAAVASGFGAATPAETPVPAAAPAVAEEPVAAPVVAAATSDMSGLAADIANLINDLSDDAAPAEEVPSV